VLYDQGINVVLPHKMYLNHSECREKKPRTKIMTKKNGIHLVLCMCMLYISIMTLVNKKHVKAIFYTEYEQIAFLNAMKIHTRND
jgi:hypothetical protein